jgi:hypothetical protein
MNAEQLLALAEALRAHALQTGADLNASNLFVHRMLVHAVHVEDASDDIDAELALYNL